MKQRGEVDDERCCSCGAPLETDDHLFQCPKRPQFQRRILALINESKPKLAPFLHQTLYDGVKQYICKYTNSNKNDDDKTNTNNIAKTKKDEDAPDNISSVNFKRVQSKFCITDDEIEDERITEAPATKQTYLERIHAIRNEIPSRKRKRLKAAKIDKRCIDRLNITQTEIGWDNLLRGKLAKGWRVCQKEYEKMKTKERKDIRNKMRGEYRNISNPYDKENNKKEPKKKKKKQKDKDVFQHLIERIFVIAEEEILIQRNQDRHQPNHKNSYTEVIKVDQEIRKLYGQSDDVRPADREDIYSIDLEQRLSQTMNEKRKWIIRWSAIIRSSIKRYKREVTTANPIWSYYNCTKEPKTTVDVIAQRRNKNHKIDLNGNEVHHYGTSKQY